MEIANWEPPGWEAEDGAVEEGATTGGGSAPCKTASHMKEGTQIKQNWRQPWRTQKGQQKEWQPRCRGHWRPIGDPGPYAGGASKKE
jgi:hypothetical protein